MTENQWPEDSAYPSPPATHGTTGERAPSTFPSTLPTAATQTGDTYGTSRTDAAKEEAGDVARTAADSAQSVAETAKSEAANVASEAKANTKELLHQARHDLTQQASAQQQKVAAGPGPSRANCTPWPRRPPHPGGSDERRGGEGGRLWTWIPRTARRAAGRGGMGNGSLKVRRTCDSVG